MYSIYNFLAEGTSFPQTINAVLACINKRKWLLNRKVFIFASSNFPEYLTLGDAPSSFPEHSTLGDAKSSFSIRVRVMLSLGFFFTFRLRSSYYIQ